MTEKRKYTRRGRPPAYSHLTPAEQEIVSRYLLDRYIRHHRQLLHATAAAAIDSGPQTLEYLKACRQADAVMIQLLDTIGQRVRVDPLAELNRINDGAAQCSIASPNCSKPEYSESPAQ